MLPEFPVITKCNQCQNIFWVADAKEIGSYEMVAYPVRKEWANAQRVTFLSYMEYYSVLKTDLIRSKEDEIFIRTRILWEYNDSYRKGRTTHESEDGKMIKKENIEALLALLDKTNENQKLFMAELYRNIGQFEKSLELLNSVHHEKLNWIKNRMIEECEKKNTLVFQVN